MTKRLLCAVLLLTVLCLPLCASAGSFTLTGVEGVDWRFGAPALEIYTDGLILSGEVDRPLLLYYPDGIRTLTLDNVTINTPESVAIFCEGGIPELIFKGVNKINALCPLTCNRGMPSFKLVDGAQLDITAKMPIMIGQEGQYADPGFENVLSGEGVCTVNGRIVYQNPIPPATGDAAPLPLLTALAAISLAALLILRKRTA